jgi:hypothetical protein
MFIGIPPAAAFRRPGQSASFCRWPNNSRAYRWSNGWYGFLIIPDMTITLGPVRLIRIRQGSIVMTG